MNEEKREEWPALPLLEFAVSLSRALRAKGMTQAQLAKKLEVTPGDVSNVVRGLEDLTVSQMSRMAEAVGGQLHVTIAPKGQLIRWVEDTLDQPAP